MFLKSKMGGASWLVVFLGNPGDKYSGTRHNVGFMTADILEKRENLKISRLRFSALTATCTLGGEKVLLMKPQTYMNLSGDAVAPAAAFYKLPPERIIVVCDDVALPLGKLRIRAKGSSGGHNGLKSIISRLGTDAFPRIKIGVGAPDHDMIDWVLGKFYGKDADTIANSCKLAADAISSLICEGTDKAMNKFN
ncbi:MAG: aminoacyl-tRNA hydrolase [Oscillospiraceae bacterium]